MRVLGALKALDEIYLRLCVYHFYIRRVSSDRNFLSNFRFIDKNLRKKIHQQFNKLIHKFMILVDEFE